MQTVIKFQKPLAGVYTHVLAYNSNNSFRQLISIQENKELLDQVFCKEAEDKIYCECEVNGGTIVKVIKRISPSSLLASF